MSIEYMSAINLSTFSELKYPSFQKDVECLEKTLEIVKNTDERLRGKPENFLVGVTGFLQKALSAFGRT